MDIHFRPKNENESHDISVFSFSYIQYTLGRSLTNSLQCVANILYLVQVRFCRWSLLKGFHFLHVHIDIFVAFF